MVTLTKKKTKWLLHYLYFFSHVTLHYLSFFLEYFGLYWSAVSSISFINVLCHSHGFKNCPFLFSTRKPFNLVISIIIYIRVVCVCVCVCYIVFLIHPFSFPQHPPTNFYAFFQRKDSAADCLSYDRISETSSSSPKKKPNLEFTLGRSWHSCYILFLNLYFVWYGHFEMIVCILSLSFLEAPAKTEPGTL